MKEQKSIPIRFSERAFLYYLPVIKEIVRGWPGPVAFSPGDLSLETFTCRLRDSIRGAVLYHWTHPDIQPGILSSISDLLVLRQIDGKVIAGTFQTTKPIKTSTVSTTTTIGTIVQPTITIDYKDQDVVHAAALLLSKRLLLGPLKLLNFIPDENATNLLNSYDIAITSSGNDTIMV